MRTATLLTENGAPCFDTTGNACLDLFSKIGGCRNNLDEATRLFEAALESNSELAIRILWWVRDIRGGAGERKVFRHLLNQLADAYPNSMDWLAELVSTYGRWDDLLCLEGTNGQAVAVTLLKHQLDKDLLAEAAGEPVSLLAKWLPSTNASSKETKRVARLLAGAWGMTEAQYRKTLVKLRAEIRIVETQMCQGNWEDIDFSKVPSRAAMIYRGAFGKHQEERYTKYLEDVAAGKAEIKAGTLFPYDLTRLAADTEDKTLQLQWEALPNYMPTDGFNGIVVADVSGSMTGQPMDVAVSLAMYVAERNTCPVWKDKFITFSTDPQVQKVVGDTLHEKVSNLRRADWGMSTDFNKVFQLILDAAVLNGLTQDQLPQKVICVSDMQFNVATTNGWEDDAEPSTNFEEIKRQYAEAGYEPPHLVFWNVHACGGTPVTEHDSGTHLVSGCSPSILQAVLNGQVISAEDVMLEAVGERYDPVAQAWANSLR